MRQLTVRVGDETAEAIDGRSADSDVSQSEAVRELLRLGTDYERLQAEADDLRRQLQAVNSRENEHQELVEYVQQEKAIQEQRQEWINAPLWQKGAWLVFGRSSGNSRSE